MAATDEAATVPTMEDLDEALRAEIAGAMEAGAASEDVVNLVEALARLRQIMRQDETAQDATLTAKANREESEARTAAHRASVALTERKGGGNRG